VKLVVFGLSLSSSWGNGHATTYRALLRAFAGRGHEVVFFEWDAPWYGGPNRDLAQPSYARLVLYDDWPGIRGYAQAEAKTADAVLVGSYVKHGASIIDALLEGPSPVFFYDIDTPVTVRGLRTATIDYLRTDQIPSLARYLSFTGGPFLDRVLEGELGARSAAVLYCSVDTDIYRPTSVRPEFAVDMAYMGTYAADRQPVVERFLLDVARRRPDLQFLVAGPQYPETERWPSNVRRISHLPADRHAEFYCSARWQLNATRADMAAAGWSPSVRIFEAGAVGAPIISDSWPGMDELFQPGREILLPATSDEVVRLLTESSDDERKAVGANLRARVVRDHSATRRASELEKLLDPCVAT
jgi:spore maturation protein CgeB